MPTVKMHADEVDTDAALVRRLLRAQYPQWADLPIARVPSAGTDNALYRLGDDMVVRLPRIGWATEQADLERQWLPLLAPHSAARHPRPAGDGNPRARTTPGIGPSTAGSKARTQPTPTITDPAQAATDLAHFIRGAARH